MLKPHFIWVNCMLCELRLNKAIFLKGRGDRRSKSEMVHCPPPTACRGCVSGGGVCWGCGDGRCGSVKELEGMRVAATRVWGSAARVCEDAGTLDGETRVE